MRAPREKLQGGGGGGRFDPPTTPPEIGLSALNSPELTGQPNPSAMVDISFS